MCPGGLSRRVRMPAVMSAGNGDFMKELEILAVPDNLDEVLQFIDGVLEGADCPMKTMMQIDLAAEEIFVNIASYAYQPGTGQAKIQVTVNDEPRSADIRFEDSGVAYNPLEKEDPDVTLSADARAIGGLGIYMVKKSVDEISYERRDGKNILTIRKYF